MPAPRLLTYRDAIRHCLIFRDALGDEAAQNRASEAVQAAYQRVHSERQWRYFTRWAHLEIQPPQTTGTVSYVASNRTLTLSGATWPSWAGEGRLTIGSDTTVWRADRRYDDTVLYLDPDFCPGSDLTDETYEIWQTVYPLPADLTKLDHLHDEGTSCDAAYVDPEDYFQLERHYSRTNQPWRYTVLGDENRLGSMAIAVAGKTTTAKRLLYLYQAAPRPLKFDGYARYSSQGTAQCTFAGGDSGKQYAIINEYVSTEAQGSILRLGEYGSDITGPPDAIGARFPIGDQRVIVYIGGAYWCYVDRDFVTGLGSGGHFVISDPVDLPAYMHNVFWRACEHEMAILCGDFSAEDRSKARYDQEMLLAMAVDQRQRPFPQEIHRLWTQRMQVNWDDEES